MGVTSSVIPYPGAERGSGRFLATSPKSWPPSRSGVVSNWIPFTGRMLKQMYPEADTYVMGF